MIRTLTLAALACLWPLAPAWAADVSPLKASIESIARSIDARWGIYVKNLETGDEIAIDADSVMETMSVIKIPIMVEAFRQVQAGKLSLGERIDWNDDRRRWGTGILQTLDSGMQPTLRDYLKLMITVSDNSGTDVVLDRVGGPAAVNATMKAMGLASIHCPGTAYEWFRALAAAVDPSYKALAPGDLFKKGFPDGPGADEAFWTFHSEEKTPFGRSTARDIGRLLEMIVKRQAVSADASKQMIDIMREQVYTTRIPRYLPNPWGVPHKTGDFPPFLANDVGVLEPGKTKIVIVVFNSHYRGQYPMLEEAVARIAREVYGFYGR